ncbi:Copper amine oxidase N-terminal domain-containing protein [Natronincola peptidivorans]|uniref:Copper amine oxidase N-terminal domain-containing protein n=1 Tax=Natronincola peptidivorans TaxID=426128 RepID=A0A1I0CQY5_9FIRM|nr:copper amine oxidase N-terminal domain-containing protein [Natronincola peptidivorans]SET22190.1 Copper amine oxidase N-terminal domain-containing protein [Natronincola peptidivorans]
MKRKLALLLALVMVLSMIPMMSFATSTNTVTRVLTVEDDTSMKDFGASIPALVLEPKDNTWDTTTESFVLELSEDAEWRLAPETGGLATSGTLAAGATHNSLYEVGTSVGAGFTIESITKRRINVTINGAQNGNRIFIPLNADLDGASGNVTVTVIPDGSAVSPGTYTFATVAGGDTVTTIDSVARIVEGATINTILMEETVRTGFAGAQEVIFVLPNHFKFDGSDFTVTYGGGYASGTETFNITSNAANRTADPVSGEFNARLSNGDRQLTFWVEPSMVAGVSRGWIRINGIDVRASKDAPTGDVMLRVRGDATNEEVKALDKVGYGMEVRIKDDKDPKEIFAGRYAGEPTDTNINNEEDHQLARLRIREDSGGAWLSNRYTTIEFPSWVKVIGVDVRTADKFDGTNGHNTESIVQAIIMNSDKGDSSVEFRLDPDHNERALLEVDFYVSVKADMEGDITATISGAGIDTEEVVLGKAIAPVKVEANTANARIGVKNQEIGTITITESKPGAIQSASGKNIVEVELDTWMQWSTEPTVEVDEDSELTIDKDSIDVDGRVLSFQVTGSSIDEPAVITITGGKVDVDRSTPEGKFAAKVGGSALVNNVVDNDSANAKLENGFFRQSYVASADVVNVTTPAPGETMNPEVLLTIGSTTFFVDGVAETLPVAPYIDAQNRTMLPVSAIGRILGAEVDWNAASRTVLVTKGSDRVLLTIGSDTMVVNGMNIPMRSEAVITGDRTFVPVRDLGVALGVATEWDAATQTVTVK